MGSFESPAYEAEIARCVRRLGLQECVAWTGFRRDVTAELLKMDLFVLPSLFGEGLPMVVLEAMAAGVPIVATRVAGVPEAVRDGRDGLLATPGDPDDLAHAVGRIVRGEMSWESLRGSALARHAEQFSDRAMAAGVAAVYRSGACAVGMIWLRRKAICHPEHSEGSRVARQILRCAQNDASLRMTIGRLP